MGISYTIPVTDYYTQCAFYFASIIHRLLLLPIENKKCMILFFSNKMNLNVSIVMNCTLLSLPDDKYTYTAICYILPKTA